MNIYSIYKATNKINGKIYIGYTNNFPRRQKNHKNYSIKTNSHFYNGIKKHGWDNFEWEIIYQSKDQAHTLNEMESYFISIYDSFHNGYNSTTGGECPDNTKAKANKDYGYILIDPNGNQYQIDNLRKFARDNNLTNEGLYAVVNQRIHQYKGWTGYPLSEKQKQNNIKRKTEQYNKLTRPTLKWEITDSNGNQYTATNLNTFCREYFKEGNIRSISRQLLYVAKGENRGKWLGWKVNRIEVNAEEYAHYSKSK